MHRRYCPVSAARNARNRINAFRIHYSICGGSAYDLIANIHTPENKVKTQYANINYP